MFQYDHTQIARAREQITTAHDTGRDSRNEATVRQSYQRNLHPRETHPASLQIDRPEDLKHTVRLDLSSDLSEYSIEYLRGWITPFR